MKTKRVRCLVLLSIAAIATAFAMIPPEPTVIVARAGMSFDEIVKRSSYPTLDNALPPEGETGFGTIDVTEPAVIIKYDHPQHGFELPPTKFAALTFSHSVLATLSTSPMLDPLRFPKAVEVLAQLQEQFRKGGWAPWKDNGSVWFDLSPHGRKALHAELMRYSQAEQWLIVPNQRVGMIFRIKCVDDCDDNDDARFLIDVGIIDELGD